MSIFSITDFDGYANSMRQVAAEEYGYDNDEDLDQYITLAEAKNIITDRPLNYDEENRPMISEDIHQTIFTEICEWIFNIGLAKLAAADKIECAWCIETNTMIFWKQDNAQNDTKPNFTDQV